MVRNKDRWSALSMKQRADLIKLYTDNGITSLKAIKDDYNSYSDGGDTENPINMGEIEAVTMTPKQSRINKRRMRKELFTKIKSTLESNGDIIQLYNSLPEDQRKRALESIMKFSSAADPKLVKDWFIEEAKKHPLKAIKALNYVITGEGQPALFEPNRKYAYNGLFGGDYYFDKQPPVDNGIVDAMLYNKEVNPNIGVQADEQDYGPEIDYINRVYPDKNIQYIETRPRIDLNQEGIKPTVYYGAQGSFKTSLPKRVINNQGIIIQEGVRNDSTFVRGLDVYDFKPDEYMAKWVSDSSMFPIIKQIDEDTNPIAIKTPWVYKDNINDIISSRTGLNGFEFSTIDSNKSVYKTQKSLGGKINKFKTGGPTEPLYYDDTYIEPAVVKAFKSQEDYNRFLGEKGARIVREGTNRVAQNIFNGLQYTPIIGDAIDVADITVSIERGDISKAAVLAGTALIPNALEKPVRAIGKGIRNLRIYNRYSKDAERFRDAVNYALDKYTGRADLLNENYGGTYKRRKLNTVEDVRKTAYNQPINTDFKVLSLFPNIGGKYNTRTDEIWLNRFRPALYKEAWNSPKKALKKLKESAAHEGTHLALYNLGDNISIPGKKYPIANPQHPLYDRVGYAFSDPNRKASTWARNPEELIANMTKVGYHLNIDPRINVRNWNIGQKKTLSDYLSRSHDFTPEDALFLAEELSDFGYKYGGRMNKFSTGGSIENNQEPQIPGLTEWFDTYVDNYRYFIVPEAPIDENELVKRQAWAESAGNDRAGSHKGAKGRYQIMPDTLNEYQKATGDIGDIYDPVYNRRVRDWEFSRYKNSDQVNRGEPTDSVKMGRRLAIYNYGYGNVKKALNKADSLGTDIDTSFDWLHYLPQETQDYVNFILRNKDTGSHRTNSAYKNRKK